ncbi:hypothetical protein ACE6ED_13900 [Paenibacillus sp. CN-4]|uniref:hypothetical protein n=1 Tax=Paenibacillus nanchangensis TaxID=3348343 RepID=UPI00397C1A3A
MTTAELEYTDHKGGLRPIIPLRVKETGALYRPLQAPGAVTGEIQSKPNSGRRFTAPDPDGLPLSIWGGWPSKGDGPI